MAVPICLLVPGPWVAWNWVINWRFDHPHKAGERNFFHPVSRNPWEVIISGPVDCMDIPNAKKIKTCWGGYVWMIPPWARTQPATPSQYFCWLSVTSWPRGNWLHPAEAGGLPLLLLPLFSVPSHYLHFLLQILDLFIFLAPLLSPIWSYKKSISQFVAPFKKRHISSFLFPDSRRQELECSIRWAPGCASMGEKVAFCLPSEARKMQFLTHFHTTWDPPFLSSSVNGKDASSFRPMPSRRWNAPFLSCRFVRIWSAICFFAFLFSSWVCVCVCVCVCNILSIPSTKYASPCTGDAVLLSLKCVEFKYLDVTCSTFIYIYIWIFELWSQVTTKERQKIHVGSDWEEGWFHLAVKKRHICQQQQARWCGGRDKGRAMQYKGEFLREGSKNPSDGRSEGIVCSFPSPHVLWLLSELLCEYKDAIRRNWSGEERWRL